MRNFEDVVIFVTDMEGAIENLSPFEKKFLAMNVLEEYTVPEVARLLSCNQRTVERLLPGGTRPTFTDTAYRCLLDELPSATRGREGGDRLKTSLAPFTSKTCQEGENDNFEVSNSNEGENKRDCVFDLV